MVLQNFSIKIQTSPQNGDNCKLVNKKRTNDRPNYLQVVESTRRRFIMPKETQLTIEEQAADLALDNAKLTIRAIAKTNQ